MKASEKYKMIKKEAKETNKKLKKLQEDLGTFDNPVEIDLIKTTKAMFYEKVVEILRQKEDEE